VWQLEWPNRSEPKHNSNRYTKQLILSFITDHTKSPISPSLIVTLSPILSLSSFMALTNPHSNPLSSYPIPAPSVTSHSFSVPSLRLCPVSPLDLTISFFATRRATDFPSLPVPSYLSVILTFSLTAPSALSPLLTDARSLFFHQPVHLPTHSLDPLSL
jgi:hypothetical protein